MDKSLTTAILTIIITVVSSFASDSVAYKAAALCVMLAVVAFGFIVYTRDKSRVAEKTARGSTIDASLKAGVDMVNQIGELYQEVFDYERDAVTRVNAGVRNDRVVPVHKVDQATAEAALIMKSLRDDHGFSIGFNPRVKGAIVKTPINILARIIEKARSPIDVPALEKALVAVSRKLARSRGKSVDVPMSVVSAGDIYVRFQRVSPEDHDWSNRPRKLSPATAAVGDYWDGPDRKSALIDMFDSTLSIVCGLICGISGSGKSHLIKMMLLSMFENSKPKHLSVYINELKRDNNEGAYDIFGKLPHVKSITRTKGELVNLLDMMVDWCDNGKPADAPDFVLLLLDEVQNATTDPDIKDEVIRKLLHIMNAGRSNGIRIWLCTQTPDADRVPPSLKMALHFKIACHTPSDRYLRTQLGVTGASSVLKHHECICVASDAVCRSITLYRLSPDDMVEEIDALADKYPTTHRSTVGEDPASTRVEEDLFAAPISPARRLTDDEAILAYRLWDKSPDQVQMDGAMSKNQLYYKVFGGPGGGDRRTHMTEAFERAENLLWQVVYAED